MMSISVVIVTYNSAKVIGGCLAALETSIGCEMKVLVVDNASPDGTAALVRSKFPSFTLLANDENRGFGAASNQAVALSDTAYLMLLNPDTHVAPDTIVRAVVFMESNPSVGIAGCKITNSDGSPQDSVSYRYPGEKRAPGDIAGLPGTIACVLGAAMIVRAEVMNELNGFDEDFFLYGEDQDLCLRARKAGWSIGFIPDAVVAHAGGHSEMDFPSGDVWRKKTLAEMLFYQKHYRRSAVNRICKTNMRRCWWRMVALRLRKFLALAGEGADLKLTKYQTIYQTLIQQS